MPPERPVASASLLFAVLFSRGLSGTHFLFSGFMLLPPPYPSTGIPAYSLLTGLWGKHLKASWKALNTGPEGLGFSLKAKWGSPESCGRETRQVRCVSGRNLWWQGFSLREEKRIRPGAGNPDRKPLLYSNRKMRGVRSRTEGSEKRG